MFEKLTDLVKIARDHNVTRLIKHRKSWIHEFGLLKPLLMLVFVILFSSSVNASEILDTSSGVGSLAYVVNCTAPCDIKLLDLQGNEIASASHGTGLDYGYFDSITTKMYNLTLWEGSNNVDEALINLGTFDPPFPKEAERVLGKMVIGVVLMMGVGLGAVKLGLEGGALVIGLGILVTSSSGYFPGWTLYVVLLISAGLFGIGLYALSRGW